MEFLFWVVYSLKSIMSEPNPVFPFCVVVAEGVAPTLLFAGFFLFIICCFLFVCLFFVLFTWREIYECCSSVIRSCSSSLLLFEFSSINNLLKKLLTIFLLRIDRNKYLPYTVCWLIDLLSSHVTWFEKRGYRYHWCKQLLSF